MKRMKLFWIYALVVIAVIVASAVGMWPAAPPAPVRFLREEESRAEQYHRLARDLKAQQAKVKAFANDWAAICESRHQKLWMGQDGDPSCQTPSAAPPADAPKK
jgi:hypothetical protein